MNRRLAVESRTSPSERDFTAAERRRLFWLRLAFVTFWIAIAVVMVLAAR
jgi:hypothetical protein